MVKNERQGQIFALLSERGYLSVKELSALLYTSESSIRRDLSALEQKRLIRRSYGGAELTAAPSRVIPFNTRSYDNAAQKQQIAAKAAALIKEGELIFLDQSSTCYFLAQALMDFKSLTVVTNNLEILNLLAPTGLTVIASGGVVSRVTTNGLIGNSARRTFGEIYADWMFFSAKALSADGVITDCTQEETHVREMMLKNAKKRVFLCDEAKINTRSSYRQCDLSEIDIAISEGHGLEPFQRAFPALIIQR